MSDHEFIESIRLRGAHMEKALEFFYHSNFNLVYALQLKYKLSKEEVLDAYSDGIIQFQNNILREQFRGEAKCSTYFFSIFKNKCIDIIRKKLTNTSNNPNLLTPLEFASGKGDEPIENKEEGKIVNELLRYLSDACRNVLMDWNDGYSMEEIAERNGLLNAHTARSKRYNCFQQLMNLIKKHKVTFN